MQLSSGKALCASLCLARFRQWLSLGSFNAAFLQAVFWDATSSLLQQDSQQELHLTHALGCLWFKWFRKLLSAGSLGNVNNFWTINLKLSRMLLHTLLMMEVISSPNKTDPREYELLTCFSLEITKDLTTAGACPQHDMESSHFPGLKLHRLLLKY